MQAELAAPTTATETSAAPAPEAPPPPEPPERKRLTLDERVALMKAAPPKPPAEEPKSEEAAADKSEEPKSDAAPTEPEADKPAEPEEPKSEPAGPGEEKLGRGKLARMAAQLRREQTAIARERETIKAERAQVAEVLEIAQLAKQDPETFFERMAKQAGTTTRDFYERLSRKRIGEDTPPDPLQEVAALRAELQALKSGLTERDKQQQQAASSAEFNAQLSAAVDEVCTLRQPNFRAKWPHAAAWPPERLACDARAMILDCVRRGIDVEAKEVADRLERVAEYEWQQMSAALTPATPATSRGATGPAKAAPKPAGNETPSANAGISGNAAASSVPARRMGYEERVEALKRAQR